MKIKLMRMLLFLKNFYFFWKAFKKIIFFKKLQLKEQEKIIKYL
jgi:hypothetical protein